MAGGPGRAAGGPDAAVPVVNRVRELHRKDTVAWADGGYAVRLALTIVRRNDGQAGFVVLPAGGSSSGPRPG